MGSTGRAATAHRATARDHPPSQETTNNATPPRPRRGEAARWHFREGTTTKTHLRGLQHNVAPEILPR
eukprot:8695922-Lingulodinium_polyedra.AAC.1